MFDKVMHTNRLWISTITTQTRLIYFMCKVNKKKSNKVTSSVFMITFRHIQHVNLFCLWSTLEAVDQRCSEVFWTATSLKKRHKCFPVNLAKIFRTFTLQNTFRQLLLWTLSMLLRIGLARQYTKVNVLHAVSDLIKVLSKIKFDPTFLDSQ